MSSAERLKDAASIQRPLSRTRVVFRKLTPSSQVPRPIRATKGDKDGLLNVREAKRPQDAKPGIRRARGPWATVINPTHPIARRADALIQLCRTEDPQVRAFVILQLEAPFHDPAWLAHLVAAAEYLRFPDASMRERLRRALARHLARLLVEDPHSEVLWAVVRRYGSLLPAEEAERLILLLSPDRPAKTRQVALQAIEDIFLSLDVPAEAATPRLKTSVRSVAEELLDRGQASRSPADDALLMNALSVSACLGDQHAAELAGKLKDQGGRLFLRMVRLRIADIEAVLRQRAGSSPHAVEALHTCGEVLRELQGSSDPT